MTCAFDATASSDPDNNPLTYAWAYGDATTGTGVTSSRTYTSTGTKTVTLTVSDGTATSTTRAAPLPLPRGQPGAGHTALVPETPRTDMPKISNGEIWDIEIVGTRVFIAGSFTTIQNRRSTNNTTYTQRGLASYNLTTGLVDTGFRPTLRYRQRRRHRGLTGRHQALRRRQLQLDQGSRPGEGSRGSASPPGLW